MYFGGVDLFTLGNACRLKVIASYPSIHLQMTAWTPMRSEKHQTIHACRRKPRFSWGVHEACIFSEPFMTSVSEIRFWLHEINLRDIKLTHANPMQISCTSHVNIGSATMTFARYLHEVNTFGIGSGSVVKIRLFLSPERWLHYKLIVL